MFKQAVLDTHLSCLCRRVLLDVPESVVTYQLALYNLLLSRSRYRDENPVSISPLAEGLVIETVMPIVTQLYVTDVTAVISK